MSTVVIWERICGWDAALTNALLGVFRRRHTLAWLIVGMTILPALLMALALGEHRAALREFGDVTAAGSLRDRSLWLYGVTNTRTRDSAPGGLTDMAQTRDSLRVHYPHEVQATDEAWTAFSGSLQRTGRVDWTTANWMRDSATILTARIAARAEAENTEAARLLVGGILVLTFSLGTSFRLLRLLRHAELMQRRLSSLMDAGGEYVSIAEPSGRILYANLALRRLRGLNAADDISRLRLSDLYPNQARERFTREALPAVLRAGRWEGETALGDAHGQAVPVAQTLLAHQMPDGAADCVALVARDLSEQRQWQASLADSQAALERRSRETVQILNHQGDALYVLDSGWCVTLMNQAAECLLGKVPVQFLGKTFWDVFPDLTGARFQEQCVQAMHDRAPAEWEFCYEPRQVWLLARAHPSETGLFLFFTDITHRVQADQKIEDYVVVLESKTAQLETQNKELEEQQEALERQKADLEAQTLRLEKLNKALNALATVDGLTALKNHRAFQEQLMLEVQRAVRYGASLTLLLVDLDHFRRYNETFGHPAGDAALKAVAHILKQAVRDTDMVARYGGEEFAILLPLTDAAGARILAERLREFIANAPLPHGALTVSIGISAVEGRLSDPGALVAQAFDALGSAKAGGRNRVAQSADSSLKLAA